MFFLRKRKPATAAVATPPTTATVVPTLLPLLSSTSFSSTFGASGFGGIASTFGATVGRASTEGVAKDPFPWRVFVLISSSGINGLARVLVSYGADFGGSGVLNGAGFDWIGELNGTEFDWIGELNGADFGGIDLEVVFIKTGLGAVLVLIIVFVVIFLVGTVLALSIGFWVGILLVVVFLVFT